MHNTTWIWIEKCWKDVRNATTVVHPGDLLFKSYPYPSVCFFPEVEVQHVAWVNEHLGIFSVICDLMPLISSFFTVQPCITRFHNSVTCTVCSWISSDRLSFPFFFNSVIRLSCSTHACITNQIFAFTYMDSKLTFWQTDLMKKT
jgi:hypothetical protein